MKNEMLLKKYFFYIFLLLMCIFLHPNAYTSSTEKVIIGTPIFSNEYSSFEKDILMELSKRVPNFSFEIQRIEKFGDLLSAIQNGEVDMAMGFITVTKNRLKNLFDFSAPYFQGSQKIFITHEETGSVLGGIFTTFTSAKLLQTFGLFLIVILLFAHIFWLYERVTAQQSFISKKYFRGIVESLWFVFNINSHIHIGKEEISHQHWGLRIISIPMWFIGIMFLSNILAIMVGEYSKYENNFTIKRSIDDVKNYRIAAIPGTTGYEYLKNNGFKFIYKHNSDESIANLFKQKIIDGYIGDDFLLLDEIEKVEKKGMKTHIIDTPLTIEKYAFAINNEFSKNNRNLINDINYAILDMLADGTILYLKEKRYPSDNAHKKAGIFKFLIK